MDKNEKGKMTFSLFIEEMLKSISLAEEPEDIDLRYKNIILMFDFTIEYKEMFDDKRLEKFQDSVFDKILELMNDDYFYDKNERIQNLKRIKHALYPHSKLDSEISNILSNFISNIGLVSIIVIYLEPTIYKSIIN
jgi:hypothetical protein